MQIPSISFGQCNRGSHQASRRRFSVNKNNKTAQKTTTNLPKSSKRNSSQLSYDSQVQTYSMYVAPTITNPTPENVIKNLERYSNIPCPYCGQEMLAKPHRNMICQQLKNAKGDEIIKILKTNKKYLNNVKLSIAGDIANIAKIKPNLNLSQILNVMYPKSLITLKKQQSQTLEKIYSKYKSQYKDISDKKKLLDFVTIGYNTINQANGTFKRTLFIDTFNSMLDAMNDQEVTSKLRKDLNKFPSSVTNKNAFIVKYATKDSKEIATFLFYEKTATLEHIKPQSEGGLTEPNNLLIACAEDNSDRSCMPLDEYLEKNNFEETLKQYISKVKSLGPYNDYCKAILNSIKIETKEKLDLTT